MSKKHMEANTQYVMENRMANQVETDAIVKALEGFADKKYGKEVERYAYHLYGRQDEPYGWYLFGISPIEELYGSDKFADGQSEKFLILGDCLDVLPDYNRVLTLKDVHGFAIGEMDGRYEAIQKWGVFQSLSMEFKTALAFVLGDEGLDETVEWDKKRKQWMLKFDVSFMTDSGSECHKTIRIPATFFAKEDTDNEFAKEWEAYRKAFSLDDKVREYADNGFSFTEATQWAQDEERNIVAINDAIREFFGREKESVTESVWVLTITREGQNFPEVHKTFEGAVDSAIADVRDHVEEGDEDEYNFDAIEKEIAEERYWKDENTNTVYDVCECPLCK